MRGVIYHVRFQCADDYMARRLPYRPAHLRQLDKLRGEGRVVAGGPEPDGTYANIFYRVVDRAELDQLLADNEFNRAGLFTGATSRAFTDFLEPLEVPPLDAGLQVSIVEGPIDDRARARTGLVELRASGRVAFGGLFDHDTGLAVVRLADQEESLRVLAGAGGWTAGRLIVRTWSQTL
jgi:uncharacterized protein YciI